MPEQAESVEYCVDGQTMRVRPMTEVDKAALDDAMVYTQYAIDRELREGEHYRRATRALMGMDEDESFTAYMFGLTRGQQHLAK